jgi:hypothetical protein
MDKGKLNFIIDALMFLCLMAMAGLGFLMAYALPPGRKVWQQYGRNLDLTWLGWDRHDWGDLHLYLAFILLGLLALHIILHWSMIVGLFGRLITDPKLRHRVALAFLVIALLLLYFPFLITPVVGEKGRGGGRGSGRQHSEAGVLKPRVATARPGAAPGYLYSVRAQLAVPPAPPPKGREKSCFPG